MPLCQVVELVFFCVQLPHDNPKYGIGDCTKDSNGPIVPDEKWVSGEGYEHGRWSTCAQGYRSQVEKDLHTKTSPTAAEREPVKRRADMTSERMFLGAFVKAYSRPVIDVRISLNAIRT